MTQSDQVDQAPLVIDEASLERQRAFSERTFGPGDRTAGVLDHVRKELAEIEEDPSDLGEWTDGIILLLDGARRRGFKPQEIIDAIHARLARNEGRVWPDWRTMDPNKAIEHDRSFDEQPVQVDEEQPCDASSWRSKTTSVYGPGGLNRCVKTPSHDGLHENGFGVLFQLTPKFKTMGTAHD